MNTASNDKTGMLAGQRVLVTGANSDIGEAVAKGRDDALPGISNRRIGRCFI